MRAEVCSPLHCDALPCPACLSRKVLCALRCALRSPPSLETPHTFLCPQKDELYLNLVLEYVPETVYRVARHFTKAKLIIPIIYVKVGRKAAGALGPLAAAFFPRSAFGGCAPSSVL